MTLTDAAEDNEFSFCLLIKVGKLYLIKLQAYSLYLKLDAATGMDNLGNSSSNLSSGTLIPFCAGAKNLCPEVDWIVYTTYVITGVSILLNIVHITILNSFRGIKGTVYHRLMMSLTVAEILNCIKSVLKVNCFVRHAAAASYVVSRVLIFYSDFASYNRYVILTIAFIDRWMAMARPFRYNDSLFVRFFWVWLLVPCVLTSIFIVIRDAVLTESICMEDVYGVTNCGDDLVPRLLCQLYFSVNLLLDSIFMVLVLWELWKMSKRQLTQDDKDVKTASRTILVLALLYYTCLTVAPLASWTISRGLSANQKLSDTVGLFAYLPISFYSVMNVVTYGLMSEGYRVKVKQILQRFMIKGSRVNP